MINKCGRDIEDVENENWTIRDADGSRMENAVGLLIYPVIHLSSRLGGLVRVINQNRLIWLENATGTA